MAGGMRLQLGKEQAERRPQRPKEYAARLDSLRNSMHSVWMFLTIVELRSYGLGDNDNRLIRFAERMAEAFNIRNVMENWSNPIYNEQYLQSERISMQRDFHEVTAQVRSCQKESRQRSAFLYGSSLPP